MKKYDTYKDSGIEWIGEIPQGWTCMKTKYALSGLQDGTHGTFDRVDDGYHLLSAKNVFEDGIHFESKESYISEADYKLITSNGYPQKGDVLLCCVGTIGRCCIFREDKAIAFQRSVAFLRPNKSVYSKFLCYEISSNIFKSQLDKFAKTSAQSGVYLGDIAKTSVIMPPPTEQQSIATYLDYKVSQIDKSVAAIDAEINDLKSYRQSVISEAVTKGLNPNVPMKDSGIEWIGEIPQGWEVMKGRYLFNPMESIKPTSEFVYIDVDAINNKTNKIENPKNIVLDDAPSRATRKIQANDILFSMVRPYLRNIAIIGEEYSSAIASTGFYVIKPNSLLNCKFTFYLMLSDYVVNGLNSFMIGDNSPSINGYNIEDFKYPVPPLPEQQTIAIYLDNKTTKIDAAIKQLEAQRADLTALKQSVISEAVTGKIDVRDWKPINA